MPFPYNVAERDARLCGVIVECDSATGRALRIERVQIRDETPLPPGEDEEAADRA
jgi:calcineurin-like phosphoesterase